MFLYLVFAHLVLPRRLEQLLLRSLVHYLELLLLSLNQIDALNLLSIFFTLIVAICMLHEGLLKHLGFQVFLSLLPLFILYLFVRVVVETCWTIVYAKVGSELFRLMVFDHFLDLVMLFELIAVILFQILLSHLLQFDLLALSDK